MGMATRTRANTFLQRLVGAAALDAAIYEEVEADPAATGQAMAVVVLSAVAMGIGASGLGLGPGAIAFAAAVDDGPSPVIIVRVSREGLQRVVGVGDALPDGARIASLTLLPIVSVGPAGAVSFAVAPTAAGGGPEGVYLAASTP